MSGINKVGGGTPILPIDQGQDSAKPAAAARPGLSTAPPPAVPFEHQFLSAHATHAGVKATATDGAKGLGKLTPKEIDAFEWAMGLSVVSLDTALQTRHQKEWLEFQAQAHRALDIILTSDVSPKLREAAEALGKFIDDRQSITPFDAYKIMGDFAAVVTMAKTDNP